MTTFEAITPQLILIAFLVGFACGQKKLAWFSLSAKQKKLRLIVMVVATVGANVYYHHAIHQSDARSAAMLDNAEKIDAAHGR